MKTIIINSSPRVKGNSKYLATKIIDTFKFASEFELIDLPKINLKPCTACRACKDMDILSYCIIKDDFNGIINKLTHADNIIFISPNHMGFISSYAKLFTDRFYCLKNTLGEVKFNTINIKFLFLLVQGSPDSKHAAVAYNWADGFFKRYGFISSTHVISGCKYDSHDGVDNGFAEVSRLVKAMLVV